MIIRINTRDYAYEDRHVFLALENIEPENHRKEDGLSKNLTSKYTVHVGQATSFIRLPDPSLEPVETISIILSNHKMNTMKYIKHR